MISEKPWSLEAVARLFLCIIATLCSAELVAGLLQNKLLKSNEQHLEFAQMVLTAVFFHGAILFWVALFLRETGLSWGGAFGLEMEPRWQAVLWGLLAGLLFLPVGLLLQYGSSLLLPNPSEQPMVQALQNPDMPLVEEVFAGGLAVFLAPVAEEVLFRGVVYPTIKRLGFPKLALWVTSLLFAGMHFNLASFVPLMVFSLLLIWLYEKTGSLWASITAHSVFNLSNFLLLLWNAAPSAPHSVK